MRDCELWVLEFFKRERERVFFWRIREREIERERVAALFWTISPITKVIISTKKKAIYRPFTLFKILFYFLITTTGGVRF